MIVPISHFDAKPASRLRPAAEVKGEGLRRLVDQFEGVAKPWMCVHPSKVSLVVQPLKQFHANVGSKPRTCRATAPRRRHFLRSDAGILKSPSKFKRRATGAIGETAKLIESIDFLLARKYRTLDAKEMFGIASIGEVPPITFIERNWHVCGKGGRHHRGR